MTMTDDELDALLRAAGDELDARSAAHVVVDRSREPRSRSHFAVYAAAGLVAASVAALIVVANVRGGTDDAISSRPATPPVESNSTSIGADVTAPSSTGLDPATFLGVKVCWDALAGYRVPDSLGEFTLPDAATAELLLLDIPGQPTRVRVLINGNGVTYSCTVERDIDVDGRIVSDSLALVPADREPAVGGIVLDDLQITGGVGTGPGSFIAIGRVGDDVVSVSVDLPDGTSYAGIIHSARFVVEGAIPTGVPLFEQRVSWILASGEERSSRADLLDEPSPAEECAATALCVEQRVVELQNVAADRPEQATILADGTVTEQEHAAANERFVTCLVDAGIDAEVLGNGYMVTDGPTEDDQPAIRECGRQHLDLVDELFQLHDAQRRLADG